MKNEKLNICLEVGMKVRFDDYSVTGDRNPNRWWFGEITNLNDPRSPELIEITIVSGENKGIVCDLCTSEDILETLLDEIPVVDNSERLNAIEYWEDTIRFALDNNDETFDKTGVSQTLLDFLEDLKGHL